MCAWGEAKTCSAMGSAQGWWPPNSSVLMNKKQHIPCLLCFDKYSHQHENFHKR